MTLAELLIEEDEFPVSFRSGWHSMDNEWQHRLDSLLPFSLHNAWPSKRTFDTEPIDNIYDWSQSPSNHIPFHPSGENYQIPGNGPGWNVRSVYMSGADSTFMDKVFKAAADGPDQVVCLWAHLPESDFLDNVRKVNTSAHKVEGKYPGVKFRYCTAVEAMQSWQGTADSVGPQITVTEIAEGSAVRWTIHSDEPLFQLVPFVAAKTRSGDYLTQTVVSVGERTWETAQAVERGDLVKIGVAATDTSGNLTTSFITYLPDDIIIDNTDLGYAESRGTWVDLASTTWGTSSRLSTLPVLDSAIAVWTARAPATGVYQIFVQVPKLTAPAQRVVFRTLDGSTPVASKEFTSGVIPNRWEAVGLRAYSAGEAMGVEMTAYGSSEAGAQAGADVVRFTPMVRSAWLVVPATANIGDMIVGQPSACSLTLRNDGVQPVEVSSIEVLGAELEIDAVFPVTVPGMGEAIVECSILSSRVGAFVDTLVVGSSDPRHLRSLVVVTGSVTEYYCVIDDQDAPSYTEVGSWFFSTAKGYNGASRYAYPAAGVSAEFRATLTKSGVYEIQEVVPTTVNATVRARYVLFVNGTRVDSVFVDQNAGSGAWVTLMEHDIGGGSQVRVVLTDAMCPCWPERSSARMHFGFGGSGVGRRPWRPGRSGRMTCPMALHPTTRIRSIRRRG